MSPRQKPTEKAVDGRLYTVDGEAKLTDKDEALRQRLTAKIDTRESRQPAVRGQGKAKQTQSTQTSCYQ
jgi:hypothetical protein